jgi:hypothetical protein
MKFGKIKNAFLIGDLLFLCASLAIICITDPLKSTREELKIFYEKEFVNFSIDNIITIPTPQGKGDYKLFSSSLQQEYFPILLEIRDDAPYNLFKVGTIINKPAFSDDLTIREGEVTHHVKIRNPKDESSTGDYLFPTVILGFVFILFLILPNTFFENLLNMMFNDKE